MSVRTLTASGIALVLCLFWAIASTIAGLVTTAGVSRQPARGPSASPPTRSVRPQPALARAADLFPEDPGYLAAFNVVPLDALLPEADRSLNAPLIITPETSKPRFDHRIVENPVWASEEDRLHAIPEADSRSGGPPCEAVAYRNRPGSFVSIVKFGNAADPLHGLADDCTLPSSPANPFICAVTVSTTSRREGGPDTYDLRVSLWDQCPDEPGAIKAGEGSFAGIPNDTLFRAHTIQVDPGFRDAGDDTLWVLLQSSNPDAYVVYGQNTVQAGDLGATLDSFALVNGSAFCSIVGFADPTTFYDGFDITLRGHAGSPGSCCDTTSGVCQIDQLYVDCDQLTQTWNEINVCGQIPCVPCPVSTCSPEYAEHGIGLT